MSIIKINPSNVQNYKIVTNPRRLFTSSSEDGVEGDVQLFADASPRLKDIDPSFAEDGYDSLGIEKLRTDLLQGINGGTAVPGIEQYLDAVNQHPQGERQQKRQEVLRYEPGVKLDKNFLSKRAIKESLFKYYKPDYNTLDWAYTNYHSLNFFKGDSVPEDSALIFRSTKSLLETVDVVTPSTYSVTFGDYTITEFLEGFVLNFENYRSLQATIRFESLPMSSLLDYDVVINSTSPADITIQLYDGYDRTISVDGLVQAINNGFNSHGIKASTPVSGKQYIFYDIFALAGISDEEFIMDAATALPYTDLQNIYAPDEQFTFDFWLKPKTPQKFPDDSVVPGTMLHMSSCYAISVMTSSLIGLDGYVDYHRLVLQLSQSAEIPPRNITLDSGGSITFPPIITLIPGTWTETAGVPALYYYNLYENYEFEVNHELLDEDEIEARRLEIIATEPDAIVIEEFDSTALSQDIYDVLSTHPILSTTYNQLSITLLDPAVPPVFDPPANELHQYVIPPAVLEETIETRGEYIWVSKPTLKDNYWNHISIRWPGGLNNGGTGSIWINGEFDTYLTSSELSLMQKYFIDNNDPDALFVGNFYEGANEDESAIQRFFNPNVSEREGLTPYLSYDSDPTNFQMRHPLWGEVHDIKIYDKYKLDHEVLDMMRNGRANVEEGLLFYLPPFFTKETRTRQILQTPFFSTEGYTNDPFNVSLSFGVGGYETNLENFVKDFVTDEYPRLYKLTSSLEEGTVSEPLTANDIMYGEVYGKASNRKRLYSVLPNDNGRFFPRFELLNTGADGESKFVDSFGARRMDLISLEDMVSTASLLMGPQTVSNLSSAGGTTLFQEIEGASPEDPSVAPGSVLTVLRRTGDPSSNELVIFDISNMFYGDRILPRSLVMRDTDPIYIDGELRFTVRDDGKGSLYRADAESKHAEWNNVGNVLYEEGLIVIKSPALRMFGKKGYSIEFRGERNIYVLEFAIPLERNELNISSNPTYKDMRPTDNANETAERFVYVTGINLHDDNLNVVARANMSQAVVKRDNDRMVVKLRMDF